VVRVVGGASTIRVERPSAIPVRLELSGGSGSVILDRTRVGQKGGKTTVETPGWSGAADRYAIEIVGGSKAIEVVGRS
jgi:hypothetical protein